MFDSTGWCLFRPLKHWINSCLALNKLQCFFCASRWVKVIVYSITFWNAPRSCFVYPHTWTYWYNFILFFLENSYFILMCYTHLCCFWIWLPFLYLTMGKIECHHLDVSTHYDFGYHLGRAKQICILLTTVVS